MPPDLVDKRLQFDRHRLELGQIAGERVLGADGFPDPVRPDLAIIDAPRDPIIVRAGLAEVGLHERQRLIAHVEAGVEAEGVHLLARRRTDAVEFADGQGFDERRTHLWSDHILAVRFAVIGGELRQNLL
jgi:hypothetical protein